MKLNKQILLILSFSVITLTQSLAMACPEIVQKIKTPYLPTGTNLCSLYDRYHAALDKLEAQGISSPERIANLHAPRMVNPSHWIREREAKNYNPWLIYSPAPQTWQ